ncbi:MAG: MFS transporter [Desulfurococcaceae archaeon]
MIANPHVVFSTLRMKAAYATAATISSIGWGLYFAFATRYIAVELGGGPTATVAFVGFGWVFTLLGIFAGKIASILGERSTILIGLLQALPITAGLYVKDPLLLAFLLSTVNFPWVIHWSIVLKVVFSRASEKPGREYSEVTIGTGVGFAAGSVASGLIYANWGASGVFLLDAALLLVPPLVYYLSYPEIPRADLGSGGSSVHSVIEKILPALISLMLVVFGRELLYSLAPVKLNASIERVLPALSEWAKYAVYGLVFSGGAIISPLVRLLAGYLVDSRGPVKVYAYTTLGYALLYWLFMKTSGLIPIVLWQMPLFPFLDTAFNVYIAKKLEREELVTGFGASYTFTAIGGASIIPLLLMGEVNVDYAGSLVTAACITSIILMVKNGSRRS